MAVTPSQIRTRFPGVFEGHSDTLLELVIVEAEREINIDTWGGEDQHDHGVLYLSAHIAQYTTPGGDGDDTAYSVESGPVTKRKVGDVELTFGAVASVSAALLDLTATPYGTRFLQWRRWIQGGAVVARR